MSTPTALKNFLSKNSHIPIIGADAAAAAMNNAPVAEKQGHTEQMVRTAAATYDTKLASLTDRLFKFYKKNRQNIPACEAYIATLNGDWGKWLKKNGQVYDFEKCKNAFIERLDNCLDESILAMQFNQKPVEKKIS